MGNPNKSVRIAYIVVETINYWSKSVALLLIQGCLKADFYCIRADWGDRPFFLLSEGVLFCMYMLGVRAL